jgi:hypothetical protein
LFAWRKGVTHEQAVKAQRSAHRRHIGAIIRPRVTYRHVTGDKAGLNRALVAGLNRVGAEIGQPIYVRDGLRTYAEQVELYEKYMRGEGPVAAFPGTSNHGRGAAADCQIGSRGGANIGVSQAARRAMKRHGLCLPVAGEPWHVEVDKGQGWKA